MHSDRGAAEGGPFVMAGELPVESCEFPHLPTEKRREIWGTPRCDELRAPSRLV